MIKRILLSLAIVALAAQLYRPARNLAAATGPNDIGSKHAVPAEVQRLLTRACYDCHSNRTTYPWYAEVQPVRWWLDSHIKDGKRHLNFTEFGTYSVKRAAKKAEEIVDEVSKQNMPMKSYTWVHPEARLTPEERKLLTDWARGLHAEIAPPKPKA